MRIKDKVWISFQDIDGIGYGDSVNAEGRIISADCNGGRFCVEYKQENYPFEMVRQWFYKHNLKKID